MIAYNIGLSKLILHNTLKIGKQYVFELPENHIFLNFIKYPSFDQLDFNNDNVDIDIDTSIIFVFLT